MKVSSSRTFSIGSVGSALKAAKNAVQRRLRDRVASRDSESRRSAERSPRGGSTPPDVKLGITDSPVSSPVVRLSYSSVSALGESENSQNAGAPSPGASLPGSPLGSPSVSPSGSPSVSRRGSYAEPPRGRRASLSQDERQPPDRDASSSQDARQAPGRGASSDPGGREAPPQPSSPALDQQALAAASAKLRADTQRLTEEVRILLKQHKDRQQEPSKAEAAIADAEALMARVNGESRAHGKILFLADVGVLVSVDPSADFNGFLTRLGDAAQDYERHRDGRPHEDMDQEVKDGLAALARKLDLAGLRGLAAPVGELNGKQLAALQGVLTTLGLARPAQAEPMPARDVDAPARNRFTDADFEPDWAEKQQGKQKEIEATLKAFEQSARAFLRLRDDADLDTIFDAAIHARVAYDAFTEACTGFAGGGERPQAGGQKPRNAVGNRLNWFVKNRPELATKIAELEDLDRAVAIMKAANHLNAGRVAPIAAARVFKLESANTHIVYQIERGKVDLTVVPDNELDRYRKITQPARRQSAFKMVEAERERRAALKQPSVAAQSSPAKAQSQPVASSAASSGTMVPPHATGTMVSPQATGTMVPPRATGTMVPPQATATMIPPQATGTMVTPQGTGTMVSPHASGTMVPPRSTMVRGTLITPNRPTRAARAANPASPYADADFNKPVGAKMLRPSQERTIAACLNYGQEFMDASQFSPSAQRNLIDALRFFEALESFESVEPHLIDQFKSAMALQAKVLEKFEGFQQAAIKTSDFGWLNPTPTIGMSSGDYKNLYRHLYNIGHNIGGAGGFLDQATRNRYRALSAYLEGYQPRRGQIAELISSP